MAFSYTNSTYMIKYTKVFSLIRIVQVNSYKLVNIIADTLALIPHLLALNSAAVLVHLLQLVWPLQHVLHQQCSALHRLTLCLTDIHHGGLHTL